MDHDKKDVFTDVSTSDDEFVISANQNPDFPIQTNQKAVFTITNQEAKNPSNSKCETILFNKSTRIKEELSNSTRIEEDLSNSTRIK